MKLYLSILILLAFDTSCQRESTFLRPQYNDDQYVKIEMSGQFQVNFSIEKNIALIEIDRLLNEGESIEIEFSNSYNLTEQQTWIFEYGQKFGFISCKLNSPIYIAFR